MICIMHIITGLATGGAETMLLKLVSRMDRRRFRAIVVSLTGGGEIGPRIEAQGIPVHALGMRRGTGSLAGLASLVQLMFRYQPEIVQGWMYHGNLAGQLGSLLAPGRRAVLWNIRETRHGLELDRPLTSMVVWLGARLSFLPARIVNNSRSSARAHEAGLGFPPEKWRLLPNGFDTEEFTPSEDARRSVRSELGVAPDTVLIGLVGRYHPVKDHAGFLRAATDLLRTHPDVRFVLVGDGVDAGNRELVDQLTDLRLRRAVSLLGRRDDVARLTAAMDVATSSSKAEGFANVVGEAMSCGVPCVVTDVGDSAWIVAETGRVVPARAPEALAAAWAELIELGADGRRALGEAARRRVIEGFSLASVVSKYEALYEEVLSQGHG